MNATSKLIGAVVVATGITGCGGSGGHGGAGPLEEQGTAVVLGSLLDGRDDPATALVGTGTIFVAGGRTASEPATDTAELLEGETGIATPVVERLSSARAGAQAVRLDEKRVLVVGGHDRAGNSLNTTEVFDLLTRSFSAGPRLAAPRDGSAVARIDSTLWLLGGKGEKSVEALDLSALANGTIQGRLGFAHEGARAVLVGRAFVIGGGRDQDPLEVFDLEGKASRLPERKGGDRKGEVLVLHSGAPFLIGGRFDGDRSAPTNESATLAAGLKSIQFILPIGSARENGVGFPFGRGTLIAGGKGAQGELARGTDLIAGTAVVSSVTTNGRPGPELNLGRRGGEAVRLEDGRVVLVGGLGEDGQPLSACEMLVPPGGKVPSTSARFAKARQGVVDADERFKDERDHRLLAEKELAEKIAELARTRSDLAASQAEVARLTDALTQARLEVVQRTAERDTALSALAGERAKNVQNQQQIDDLTRRAQGAEQQLAQAQIQIKTLEGQNAVLNTQIAALKDQVEQLRNQIKTQAPAAAAPAAPAPAGSGPTVKSTKQLFFPPTPNATKLISSILPQGGLPGQTVKMEVGAAGLPKDTQVFFSTVPAKIVDAGLRYYPFGPTTWIDVTIPQGAPSDSKVQLIQNGITSPAFDYRVGQ